MIASSTEKKIEAPLTDEEIVVELTNLIFAGTDTTGTTFTYMFWELARNPQWQNRLREELEAVSWEEVVPKYKAVSQLSMLEAVVQETLRLWPAAPASLPRIALAKGGTVDGIAVPGHVSVCPPHKLHWHLRVNYSPRLFSPLRATQHKEIPKSSPCLTSSDPTAGCQRMRLAKDFTQTWTSCATICLSGEKALAPVWAKLSPSWSSSSGWLQSSSGCRQA